MSIDAASAHQQRPERVYRRWRRPIALKSRPLAPSAAGSRRANRFAWRLPMPPAIFARGRDADAEALPAGGMARWLASVSATELPPPPTLAPTPPIAVGEVCATLTLRRRHSAFRRRSRRCFGAEAADEPGASAMPMPSHTNASR